MGTSASQHTCGYRVLDVQPNSPGLQAGLVSFFDFIMKAADETFETEGDALVQILTRFQDRKLPLVVYNTKSQTFREISIVPSASWGGDGLLGITIRHDSYDASDNCIRVLSVVPGSPAHDANLVPEMDYILGTAAHTFVDSGELFELVQDHLNKTLDLYVYNSKTDRVSLKRLRPSTNWGGEGCLGLDVGQGYIHALPSESRKTNGVACSLTGFASATARSAVAATAKTQPAARLSPRSESKTSRAAAAAQAAAAQTAADSPAAGSAAPKEVPPAAAVLPTAAQSSIPAPAAVTSRPPPPAAAGSENPAGPVVPARLPLATTLSPREAKRAGRSRTSPQAAQPVVPAQ